MKPKQYIQGYTEFYKLKFKVTPDVLIPRPETELLVDEALSFCKKFKKIPTIIDIGTGSGCITISLAKNLPKARIFASDISPKALKVASENAKIHKVSNQIKFIQSDLLFASRHPELDSGSIWIPDQVRNDNLIIVTNLPYIPSSRIPYLDCSVKDHEPKIALDGGPDGFDLYRKLFSQMIEKNLIPKLFVGEIDYTQGELATHEAQKYFPNAKIQIKLDLAKKQRILVITH